MDRNLRSRRRLVCAAAVVLTYLFLLLLSQGFVTSGDDWYFSARDTGEGFLKALDAGFRSARGHYVSVNGRLLGNAFSRFFGTNDIVRELARCGIILIMLLQMCRMAKIQDPVTYLAALGMTIAIPADLYAQSYAWAAGFFNYVPPIMMIFAYLLRSERVLDGGADRPVHGLWMFLVGLSTQFFVENVTVGMCLASVLVLGWYLAVHKKLSWSLAGHFVGVALGCAVMFSAPGYSNINSEGYRSVGTTIEELMKVIQTNFGTITMYLTERNWLVIVPLTGFSLFLLHGAAPEKVWQQWLRKAAIVCLMVCPVYFYANYNLLRTMDFAEWMKNLRFWLDVAANLAFLLSVLAAAVLGVGDGSLKRRCVLVIVTIPMVFGPLVAVNPIGPRCLFIPYMMLVCLMLMLASEALARLERKPLKGLGTGVALTVAAVLLCHLWVALWNGHCERVRLEQIENALETGAVYVEIPSYPYTAYIHNGNGHAVKYYYYHETPGDLEFAYVPYDKWYLSK